MVWSIDPPFFSCFIIFVVCAFAFLLWGDRMQQRSPWAFRQLRVFGFTCSACVVAELARNNGDLDQVLAGGYPPELLAKDPSHCLKVARDIRRSLRDDFIMICIYTLMLLAAAEMAADSFGSYEVRGLLLLAIVTVAAGAADVMENLGIWRALDTGRHTPHADRTAAIRRWSLVKWTLLAILGVTLSVLLLLSGGRSGSRVLMASIAGWLMLPFGGFCVKLLRQWWKAPLARW